MSNQQWDGASYDRISGIQQGWGAEVLARLHLRGNETVLDAGCGSGRISEMIAARVPRGRVIAIDASASMAQAAGARLASLIDEGRAEVLVSDLLELELTEPVDAILSTATFHWIADHDRLFRRMRAALRPGGSFVAQCGGEGNIDGLRARARELLGNEPYAQHFVGWRDPWNYAGAEITRERLLAAGFASAETWLTPAPSEPEHPREFLTTVVLGPHVQQLPAELRERFMDDAMDALGEPVVIDYVRLNIVAVA
ncbi:MAG TPA: methyltransferase domain-containing protein [Solirubrobacteraceae bacterium]|jgi:trans-aconitate 2-methyltransferase|nr:methyltransferase domain-containing protein [Solirubrobacteraceae bacterium]